MTLDHFGRPREHDRLQIAKDLIEWSQLETSVNLNGFCSLKKIIPSKIIIWAKADDYFRSAYEEAKANLGQRRERMLSEGTLHQKAYHLNIHVYDQFVKEESRDEKKFESELTSQIAQQGSEEQNQKLDAILSTMKQRQSSCKIEDNNINKDSTS